MHTAVELMRALECGFALGRNYSNGAHWLGLWTWIRLSQSSGDRDIEHGGWGSQKGLATLTEDLIRYPWIWHIGLIEQVLGGFRGDFEVALEDSLPWTIDSRLMGGSIGSSWAP